jgi:hypothetical protein
LAVLAISLLFAPGAAPAPTRGTPVAWGCAPFTDYGQCGVPAALSDATAIAASSSYYHSLALRAGGTVVAWGCADGADFGQCSVPGDLSGVTAIAAGGTHSLALKSDGTVVAWGCADGSDSGQCSPPAGLTGVTAIAAGAVQSLALKSDGTVVAWGCLDGAASGQCDVPGGLAGVTAIAASERHSLALKADGTVVAWGCGSIVAEGQCSVPVGLSGVTAIAAATDHSLALKSDGTVVAWGCGAGTDFGQCSVPVGLSGVTAIAAGYAQSLALRRDGTVVAWGCGGGYDLGQCSVPSGLFGATAIAGGLWHSLALIVAVDQTIAFGALPNRTYGDPDVGVDATASSGLPVSFSASGSCTVGGGAVHLTRAGSCTITASQAGNVNYNAAPDVSQSFSIAKAGQSIGFGALASMTFGTADFAVSATVSSGLAVSFAASGNCTVSGATVHITAAGSCTVTASQAGSENYNAAASVSQTFAIARGSQSIAFPPLANRTFGASDFGVSATASSGLLVSFAARGSCRISGATVHLTGVGSCTVTTSQPGDANYEAAPDVSRTFSIARAPCRVPRVVGKQLASARLTIALRHCRIGKVGYAYSRKRMKGTVIAQGRRPGRVLPARSKIDLVVSRGRRG